MLGQKAGYYVSLLPTCYCRLPVRGQKAGYYVSLLPTCYCRLPVRRSTGPGVGGWALNYKRISERVKGIFLEIMSSALSSSLLRILSNLLPQLVCAVCTSTVSPSSPRPYAPRSAPHTQLDSTSEGGSLVRPLHILSPVHWVGVERP